MNHYPAEQSSSIIAWGHGEFGQHGQRGHKGDISFSQAIGAKSSLLSGQNIKLAACGSSHTVVVTDDGAIFAWGNGTSGQLGSSDTAGHAHPVQVLLDPAPPDDVTVSSVACGSRHSMVVLSNGHVYSFGNNFYAQLGYDFQKDTYKENQSVPNLLKTLIYYPVQQVSCGDKHSIFLFHNGTVSVVGHNDHGQIGDGTRKESVVPKQVDLPFKTVYVASGRNHNLVVDDNGDVHVWGYCKGCGHRRHDVLSPELKLQGKQVVQVAAGGTHSMALTASGDIYTWGFGVEGQLGRGERTLALASPRRIRHPALSHSVSYIDCGESFSAALTRDGHLYMWGKNSHVILPGFPSNAPSFEPLLMSTPTGGGANGGATAKSTYVGGARADGDYGNGVSGGGNRSLTFQSIHCGAWHAVALFGKPEHQPVEDQEAADSEDSESEPDTMSESSEVSSMTNGDSNKLPTIRSDGPPEFAHNAPIEMSAPPEGHVTRSAPPFSTSPSSRAPRQHQSPPGLQGRAQTKLTLGEFYANTDSSGSPSHDGSARSIHSGKEDAKYQDNVNPEIRVFECSPNKHDSDEEEEETEHAKENNTDRQDMQSPMSPESSPSPTSVSSEVSESSLKKRIAENIKSDSSSLFRPREWKGNQRPFQPLNLKSGTTLPAVISPRHEQTKILNTRSPNLRSTKAAILCDRAHTVFISRTTADHFMLPREPTSVAKQSVSLVDLNHLRTGSIFDPDSSDDEGSAQPHSLNSPRFDLNYTPVCDRELQDVFGQRTPNHPFLQQSSSETPSSTIRSMRMQEMLGQSTGSHQSGPSSLFASPSPNFGRHVKQKELINSLNAHLVRSKSMLGALPRGANKFYRKPGLPGSTMKTKPIKMQADPHHSGRNLENGFAYGTSLGCDPTEFPHNGSPLGKLDPLVGHAPLSTSATPYDLAPLSVHVPNLAQTHTNPPSLKNNTASPTKMSDLSAPGKKNILSTASPWRSRMNTTLGNEHLINNNGSSNSSSSVGQGARNPETSLLMRHPTLLNAKKAKRLESGKPHHSSSDGSSATAGNPFLVTSSIAGASIENSHSAIVRETPALVSHAGANIKAAGFQSSRKVHGNKHKRR